MALIQMETLEEAIEALVVSYHFDINSFYRCVLVACIGEVG